MCWRAIKSETNRVYLNDGTGHFTDADDISGDRNRTSSLITADIDGDGDIDVLVGNDIQANRVYINDGAGNFTGADISSTSYNTKSLAVADINGDGSMDVLEGNYNQSNYGYLNSRIFSSGSNSL